MTLFPSQWSMEYEGWIIVIVVLSAIACAIPGCFLLVRRQAMLGDAISHAVLPGIALGFLVSGTRGGPWIVIGAGVAGVVTAMLSQLIHVVGRVERGASLGIVFSTLFALGLVLIVQVQSVGQVDLDPGCVLYGEVELAAIDYMAGTSIPRAVPLLFGVIILSVVLLGICWKEILVSSFDPAVAFSQGIRPGIVQQALMVVVAVTCVAVFESVGSILVIALLVAPAAAARLLTDRLSIMVCISVLAGMCMAVSGVFVALLLPSRIFVGVEDVSISGSIAAMGGVLVVLLAIISPRSGVLSRTMNVIRLKRRILEEDLVGALYRLEVEGRAHPSLAHLIREIHTVDRSHAENSSRQVSRAIQRLIQKELVTDCIRPSLTAEGRVTGATIVRTHRLWERFFANHAEIPIDHLHDIAMDLEHASSPELELALENFAAGVDRDPQGREIPKIII